MSKLTRSTILALALLVGGAVSAPAVPTPVTHDDSASYDTLVVPTRVEEIGIAPGFSGAPASLVTAPSAVTASSDCIAFPNDSGIPNLLLTIINTTGRTRWREAS